MGSMSCACDNNIEDPIVYQSQSLHDSKILDLNTNTSSLLATNLSTLVKRELTNTTTLSIWSNLPRYSYPDFNSDEMTKYSKLILKSGLYFGEASFDTPQGRGFIIYNDGSLLEGTWKEGKVTGKARVVYSNKSTYEGEYLSDQKNGYGIQKYFDGRVYQGLWENSELYEGKEIFPDNSEYNGTFKNGKREGQGVFIWNNGARYTGSFINDKFHGEGLYVWSDKRIYDGMWSEGKLHGKGRFIWPDGRKYIGEFCNDYRHGLGKYFWPNGNAYDGQWYKGKKHGSGNVYIKAKNQHYKGQWLNGTRIKWSDS
ncbi:hypothetical protein SteCoe_9988 [Stentor coeruleus]|uniref:MORN repeat protein n=1 Tax=Stentor coeruleus TaxID=5963 RepID=A0A1R2CGL7_9CILI|nr:hypothetical protein SteCoe_9988 [Stentor coeruleus]